MTAAVLSSSRRLSRDLLAGVVVFLVAVPLCLGIALASNAPLVSGLMAGIIGGVIVGALSGSHTSVSGPAAGLTAVVAAQIEQLGSFEAFLAAVLVGGAIQVMLGVARAGSIAAFFPSSVIKGLLAAIGVIIILKQIPHLVGHDPDVMGEMSFWQPDGENTFSELAHAPFGFHPGAALVGLLSLGVLIGWDRMPALKRTGVPAALVVVAVAVALNQLFPVVGDAWVIGPAHLVQVPSVSGPEGLASFVTPPDWSQLTSPVVYGAGLTIAIIASLETLLNLKAVDNLDPKQRHSPPNRELVAQGVGNMVAGAIGGLPVTSVIVRGTVNVSAGSETKRSAIAHGIILGGFVLAAPGLLNQIPLACLAAILVVTGFKLANADLVRQMWREGYQQFLPFVITVVAIVMTDLLIGIVIGLVVSISFILHATMRHPVRRILERHAAGDVLRIELASQVGFFSRPSLEQALLEVPDGGHVLIDARRTDYIDQDVLDFLEEFRDKTAPAHGIAVSVLGLKNRYEPLADKIQFVDHTSRDLQSSLTPERVLEVLEAGNERFRTGDRLTRDPVRQVSATADGQAPMAVIFSCIDSRTPAELIFDLGIGDIFSVRIAGNAGREKTLGSIEYACAVAKSKLVVVMGHTACGAVTAAVDLFGSGQTPREATGCDNLDAMMEDIQEAIEPGAPVPPPGTPQRQAFVDAVARRNVLRVMRLLRQQSGTLDRLLRAGDIGLIGAVYDVRTGRVEFFDEWGERLRGSAQVAWPGPAEEHPAPL